MLRRLWPRLRVWLAIFALLFLLIATAQRQRYSYASQSPSPSCKTYNVSSSSAVLPAGFSGSSVNTVIFRRDSISTRADKQIVTYYSARHKVVIGIRNISDDEGCPVRTTWNILISEAYNGYVIDAHNCISSMIDQFGYIHLVWDGHAERLRYARSTHPWSLSFKVREMLGTLEDAITYPEFLGASRSHQMYFLYRHGRSGDGSLVMNRYDSSLKRWTRVHDHLLTGRTGKVKRSPYWQTYLDSKDRLHLSWVWRDTPKVETNHDMAYAYSDDGGKTWFNFGGQEQQVPITYETSSFIARIPTNSSLMNQGTMAVHEKSSTIYICTYWTEGDSTIPQLWILQSAMNTEVKQKASKEVTSYEWKRYQVTNRVSSFSLAGGGTKRVALSRPLVLVDKREDNHVYVVFRDDDHFDNGFGVASCYLGESRKAECTYHLISPEDLGQWEPTCDSELWKEKQILHLFVQKVYQQDGNDRIYVDTRATPVYVYRIDLRKLIRGEAGAVLTD